MENTAIRLAFYEDCHREALYGFELGAEQEKFTASAHDAIQTLGDPNRHLIVILVWGRPVGYFILHGKNGPLEIGSHEHALLIRSLAINAADQRKGYALEAMLKLPEFARKNFRGITELILIVNHANLPAQKLYQKAGFIDSGFRRQGKIGEQYIYHYFL